MFEPLPDKSRETILEVPARKTRKNMGNTPILHGTLWEIDTVTHEVTEAKYEASALQLTNSDGIDLKKIHHQAIIRPGYFYAKALNKNNALRKFFKISGTTQ